MSDEREDDPFKGILGELATPAGAPRIVQPQAPKVAVVGASAPPAGGGGGDDPDPRMIRRLIAQLITKLPESERREIIGGGGTPVIGIAGRHVPPVIISRDPLAQIEDVKPVGQFIDELDKFALDKAKAAHEAGGDEFLTHVQMQKGQHEELVKEAPFARIAPPSVLNTVIGNQAMVKSGQEIEVANWVGKDEETLPVSVILGPVAVGNIPYNVPVTSTPPRPYAKIYFGTRGFLMQAIVDIADGCQFTINASAVRVVVGMPAALTGKDAISLLLTGMLSFGAGFRTQPITSTTYVDTNTTFGGHAVSNVPAFAKSVRIFTVSNAATTKMQAVLFDGQGGQLATLLWQGGVAAAGVPSYSYMGPILLPPDCYQIKVDPNGGDDLPSVRFVYELAI